MKPLILFILFVIGASEPIAGEYEVSRYGPYKMTQVSRDLDGDTFEGWVSNFIYQTTFVRVRIRDIDAPEPRGSSDCEKVIAKRSKEYLMTLLENSPYVMLDNLKYDSFGRVLASVIIDKGDVGQLMMDASLAHPYSQRDLTWCSSG